MSIFGDSGLTHFRANSPTNATNRFMNRYIVKSTFGTPSIIHCKAHSWVLGVQLFKAALAIMGFLPLVQLLSARASEPDAQAIIRKADEAMSSTMSYQIASGNGGAARIAMYQKMLPNGTTIARGEISYLKTKQIYLYTSQGHFQLFPEAQAAVDLTSLEKFGPNESSNINGFSPFANIAVVTAEWRGLAAVGGKTCYKIRALLTSRSANLSDLSSQKDASQMPDACEYLIETNSYHVLEVKLLKKGGELSSSKFENFGDLSELSEEFLTIPADWKIEKPTTLSDFTAIKARYIRLAHSPKKLAKDRAIDPVTGHIVRVDPATGAFSPITNSGSRNGQFAGNQKRGIRVVIISGVVVISCIALFGIIFWQRSQKTKTS